MAATDPALTPGSSDLPSATGPAPTEAAGLWSPERRQLTTGLVLTVTLVAFEALAIATVMPEVKDDLGGLALYGWVFSGFFLASLLGIVLAGQSADRRGLVLPYVAGLVLFAAGLAVGGAATSMPMLVLARMAQGFGAGAVPALAYVAIARGYPPVLRPRMFAVVSTAWVVPGLIGPAIATLVEHALSWRWVFLGLLPIVVIATAMTVPALAALPNGDPDSGTPTRDTAADRRRLARVTLLVIGVGGVLGAGSIGVATVAIALVVVGVPVAVWAFVGLVPADTLRLAPGVPATIAVRGLLTWAFFSADAYVPLAIIDGRGAPTWVAGLALSATTIFWAAGSWIQARLIDDLGPRRLDRYGFTLLAVGASSMIAVSQGLPVGLAVPGWGIAGLGIGMAHAPLTLTVLAAAKPSEAGAASASLQLSDTLGIALGTGFGGWIISVGDNREWAVSSGVTVAFVASLVVVAAGLWAAGRLPARVPASSPG